MIYLLRHGETEWNTQRRIQGAGDSPLTERGEAQARAIGALLRRCIDRPSGFTLVSSPQGRAFHTASIIGAALDLPVATDSRLVEVTLGSWDGLTWEEIASRYPGALDGATHGRSFRAPAGESYERARQRVADWLAGTTAPTIAVSHGLTGKLMRGVYANLGRDDTLRQAEPQDGAYRLLDGALEFLPCGS